LENPTLAQALIKDCLEKIAACHSHMLIIALNCIFKKVMQTSLLEHSRNNNNKNILSREQYGFWMKLTKENATY